MARPGRRLQAGPAHLLCGARAIELHVSGVSAAAGGAAGVTGHRTPLLRLMHPKPCLWTVRPCPSWLVCCGAMVFTRTRAPRRLGCQPALGQLSAVQAIAGSSQRRPARGSGRSHASAPIAHLRLLTTPRSARAAARCQPACMDACTPAQPEWPGAGHSAGAQRSGAGHHQATRSHSADCVEALAAGWGSGQGCRRLLQQAFMHEPPRLALQPALAEPMVGWGRIAVLHEVQARC